MMKYILMKRICSTSVFIRSIRARIWNERAKALKAERQGAKEMFLREGVNAAAMGSMSAPDLTRQAKGLLSRRWCREDAIPWLKCSLMTHEVLMHNPPSKPPSCKRVSHVSVRDGSKTRSPLPTLTLENTDHGKVVALGKAIQVAGTVKGKSRIAMPPAIG